MGIHLRETGRECPNLSRGNIMAKKIPDYDFGVYDICGIVCVRFTINVGWTVLHSSKTLGM